MELGNTVITETDNLSIRHKGKVHDGKIRSVYWLNQKDSDVIGEQYFVCKPPQLGVMVISDRVSAFDCIWQSENLKGVPGKGATLNAISEHWFNRFEEAELTGNHILDKPHPLVWIVQKAEPIMVEAIARQYLTGSMWREYKEGVREFCGIQLPNGLEEHQELNSLLITPTTKGVVNGIPGFSEREGQEGYDKDDADISRQLIFNNFRRFGFRSSKDIDLYEILSEDGFELISEDLDGIGKIFVDTKFEFGYMVNQEGRRFFGYIDEVGTPDSSRYWEKEAYDGGEVKEKSKEYIRKKLLGGVPDPDVLLNDNRMDERKELAKTYRLKDLDMLEMSKLYYRLAREITGSSIPGIINAREEIIASLDKCGLIG